MALRGKTWADLVEEEEHGILSTDVSRDGPFDPLLDQSSKDGFNLKFSSSLLVDKEPSKSTFSLSKTYAQVIRGDNLEESGLKTQDGVKRFGDEITSNVDQKKPKLETTKTNSVDSPQQAKKPLAEPRTAPILGQQTPVSEEAKLVSTPKKRTSIRGRRGEKESNENRLKQRQKQIDMGKATLGYQNYIQKIPKDKRSPEDPLTPDKYQICSKRSWDGQVSKWRRLLHNYDPPSLATQQESEKESEKEHEIQDENEEDQEEAEANSC